MIVANAANGSVTHNSDGSFSYTPNADFNGADCMDDKGILVAPGNLEQQMKNCYSDLE